MTRGPAVADLIRGAAEAAKRGDRGGAEREFARVLELDPANPQANNALGMAALSRGDLTEAENRFKLASESDPSAPALWMNLATTYRRKGDDEAERAALLRALDADQRHILANIRLAELHERLDEIGPANFRWGAVLALANAMPERPPGLEALLAHAQDYVASRGRELGELLEASLAPVREDLAASDRRRFDACVDLMLGRRRVFHNECSGLHFPFLPADEFFDREHFPWFGDVEAQTEVIRAEFEALLAEELPGFEPYVAMESGLPSNKWTPLDHSLDWSALHLWRHGERIDEACRRCPRTAEILESVPRAHVPKRMPTAFFSVLKPRTHLPAHTGVTNLRAIIHLPLIVPPGCRFRVGGEIREWRVGEAFAFDDTIDHEAWNDSDQLRAVLIFDTWNPHIREAERALLAALFKATDESGLDPGGATALSD